MKLLILLLGFCAYQASAYTVPDDDAALYRAIQESGISPYIMEDQVQKKMEEFFKKMRDEGYDPWNFLEEFINITNSFIELKGKLENFHLENLVNITISDLKLTLIPLSVTTKLSWEPIEGYTDYDLQGTVLELIPLFGLGHLQIRVKGLYVYVSASLTSQGSNVVIRTLDVDFNIEEIHLGCDGLLGGDFGTLLCDMMNENIVRLIGQFKDGYLQDIIKIITGLVNKALEGKTINDIIDWITGKTTTPKPTTTPSYY